MQGISVSPFLTSRFAMGQREGGTGTGRQGEQADRYDS